MNPFILNAYHSSEYFCDREEETKALFNAIESNRNITLSSKRRMGKTGLLKHLEQKLSSEKNIQFIYFDILPTINSEAFMKLFADSLFRSTKSKIDNLIKNFTEIFSAFKPSFSLNPVTNETNLKIEINNFLEPERTLETIINYLIKSKKKYVIAIDEFQQITNYTEKNFEAVLRSYFQNMNNATFIFSGSSKSILSNMFTNSQRPFYMSSQMMYLEHIEKEKYSRFIHSHFTTNKFKIENNAIDHIMNLTNIHTYYVQLLCNRLYSERTKLIDIELIDSTFEKILIENRFYFENYKNLLTDLQWKVLIAIAKEKKVNHINSNEILTRYSLGSASSANRAVNSLEKKEIILYENGGYIIQDILFSAWLSRL